MYLEVGIYCSALDGTLSIHDKSRKERERHVFLFDNMVVLCKPTRRSAPSANPEYRFKEKLLIKHIEVVSLEDSEGERGGVKRGERGRGAE